MPFVALDHVQLAMPEGDEEKARVFFCDLIGMEELPKPPALAKRGGCWFRSGDVQIHLGVERDFRPSRKAHPALRCSDYAGLITKLNDAGVEITTDDNMPGTRRCYINDPFGNRIELIAD